MQTLKIGIIGMGFMGRTHLAAFQTAARNGLPCQVTAICDENASLHYSSAGNLQVDANAAGQIDFNQIECYSSASDLLGDPSLDLISICTYTDSHVDLAINALRADKHVLLEKPVALRSSEVRRLLTEARKCQRLCMPAMCMRFWPAWVWLRDRVIDGSLGRVRSAVFQRLGSKPTWSNFYSDYSRSGGPLFDMHIHDADFIYWCFGLPAKVRVAGNDDHFSTQYFFRESDMHVTAEAAWDLPAHAGFRMRYFVVFEHAAADFELQRQPQLILHHHQKSEPINCSTLTGYDCEIREFIKAISQDYGPLRATLDDALAVTQLLEAEQQSLKSSKSVEPLWQS